MLEAHAPPPPVPCSISIFLARYPAPCSISISGQSMGCRVVAPPDPYPCAFVVPRFDFAAAPVPPPRTSAATSASAPAAAAAPAPAPPSASFLDDIFGGSSAPAPAPVAPPHAHAHVRFMAHALGVLPLLTCTVFAHAIAFVWRLVGSGLWRHQPLCGATVAGVACARALCECV